MDLQKSTLTMSASGVISHSTLHTERGDGGGQRGRPIWEDTCLPSVGFRTSFFDVESAPYAVLGRSVWHGRHMCTV